MLLSRARPPYHTTKPAPRPAFAKVSKITYILLIINNKSVISADRTVHSVRTNETHAGHVSRGTGTTCPAYIRIKNSRDRHRTASRPNLPAPLPAESFALARHACVYPAAARRCGQRISAHRPPLAPRIPGEYFSTMRERARIRSPSSDTTETTPEP